MAANNVLDDFLHAAVSGQMPTSTRGINRPPIMWGRSTPDDTADVAMVYINMDGRTGDTVIWTWDNTAGVWDAMTA